jgi:magnesium-transporting ATPase (P-type)
MLAGTFGLFLWEQARDTHVEAARTVAVNTLVMFELFYLLNSRYLYRSTLSIEGLLGNKYVPLTMALLVILQLLFTYFGPMQRLFHTVALGWDEWLRITAVGSTVLILVEVEKSLLRYWRGHKNI